MASDTPDITLFDLANTKQICFSPMVWRTRLMLNFKKIPYRTRFIEFPDIEPTLKELGIPPHTEGALKYTVPVIHIKSRDEYIMDSAKIAEALEAMFPEPSLQLDAPERSSMLAKTVKAFIPIAMRLLLSREPAILSEKTTKYYLESRERMLGRPLVELTSEEAEEVWQSIQGPMAEVAAMLKANGGPFVLGSQISYADFPLLGFMAFARVVAKDVFDRICSHDGLFKQAYIAAQPWMEKID